MSNSLSSFWLDDLRLVKGSPEYVMRLNSIRRAIANFVHIVTGEDIPVKFSSGKQSYTSADARVVVISATDDPTLFDANVGLALHEAAHLILTKRTRHPGSIPVFTLLKTVRGSPLQFIPKRVLELGKKCGRSVEQVGADVGKIVNILEDRRIDKWMYQNALGYQGYYDAMYELYWQSADTEALIRDPISRRRVLKCYMFHFCNMTNQAADPDALPGLPHIWTLTNLPNIERFADDPKWAAFETNPLISAMPEMANVAIGIAETMYRYSDPDADPEDEEDEATEEQDGASEGTSKSKKGKPDPDNLDMPDDVSLGKSDPSEDQADDSKPGEDREDEDEDVDGEEDEEDEAKEERDAIDKALEAAVPLTALKQDEQNLMDLLEEAGAEVKYVGNFTEKARVIVFHKMTLGLLSSPAFPFTYKQGRHAYLDPEVKKAVTRGAQMGTLLASKLSVLADESLLTFTRQRAGKLDKRLIAGLGYDEDAVFSHSVLEHRDPIELHVTLDSSGSMQGAKWLNTIRVAVALAKAATMLPTLHVSISLRTAGMDGVISVVLAFDSKVDEFQKVAHLFPYLHAAGSTPEGLAFEAIKDTILNTARPQSRKFFLNISDGMPEFGFPGKGYSWHSYQGSAALKHTASQVRDLKDFGFSVIAYFIGTGIGGKGNDHLMKAFRTMYGQSAEFIDVENVNHIARTLNKLFLS